MSLNNLLSAGVLIAVTSQLALAQSVIPDLNIGARNAALGNANMSEYHDITSMYENPAAIAFLGNASVALNHTQGNYREMQENLAFPLLYGQDQMLAVSAQVYNLGEISRSASFGGYRLYGLGYNIAYAHTIIPTLSAGGAIAFRQGAVSNINSTTAASYTMGVDYVPSGGFSYGLTFGGLGSDVTFPMINNRVRAVRTVLPTTITIGATMKFPAAESMQSPFLVIAMSSEKLFKPSVNIFRGGIELLPIKILAVRFGYVAGSGLNEPTFGLGVHLEPIQVDAAMYPVRTGSSTAMYMQLTLSSQL